MLHLYGRDIIRGDAASTSPYPILWIDSDTLEYSDAHANRVHWNVLSPFTTSVMTLAYDSKSPALPSTRAVVAVSHLSRWALVLDPPTGPFSAMNKPAQYLYDVKNRRYTKLDPPFRCRLHATLMSLHGLIYLVTMKRSSVNATHDYQVRTRKTLLQNACGTNITYNR